MEQDHKPKLPPSVDELIRQHYPNWDGLPEDEQGRLLIMWLNDWLLSEESKPLRHWLGLADQPLVNLPPGTPKDIHHTAEYWYEVHTEAEAFWDKRYDPTAAEDW